MSQMIQLLRGATARRVLIGTIALFFCVSFPHNARADWVSFSLWYGQNDDAIDYIEKFVDVNDENSYLSVYVFKDGTYIWHYDHASNPNPDDSSSGPKGDQQSRIDLAKQHGGGNWLGEREFWDSPLGRSLTSKGKGPPAVINPGDDNTGAGQGNPSRGKEKLGDPLIIDKTGGLGAGGEGGIQFNAGSPAEQFKNLGTPPGNPDGDDDDKGSHKPPPGTFFGSADLVDPLGPPIARTAKSGPGKGKHVALGGPDTNTWTGKSGRGLLPHIEQRSPKSNSGKAKSSERGVIAIIKPGEGLLPYIEQKSPKTSSGKTKGSERGVIAIIKPGDKTGIGNAGVKGKGQHSNLFATGLLDGNTGFAASGPAASGSPIRAGTHGGALR